MSSESRRSWREAITTYLSPSALALLLLGFSAGLPAILVFSTLSVWLREAGVSRETIGYASWISLAYAFKWVWAPILDQWRLPWLHRMGRRRSWLFFSQTIIALGLIGMALCDPQYNLSLLIALAVAVAFASATQDIAIDAYRLEIAESDLQATLAATYMTGYRIAMLLANAGALFLAEWLGSSSVQYQQSAWSATYIAFALLIIPGLATTWVIREPALDLIKSKYRPPLFTLKHQMAGVGLLVLVLVSIPTMINAIVAQAWPRATLYALFLIGSFSPAGRRGLLPIRTLLRQARQHDKPERFEFVHQAVSIIVLIILMVSTTGMMTSFYGGYWPRGLMYLIISSLCLTPAGRNLLGPVLAPITDFVQRYRWQALIMLGLIATYRMSDTVMGVMANVFYIDQGFSKEEIASISKIFGLVMTLLGAGFGGILIARFRIMPILFIGAIASAGTNIMFMLLSHMGANVTMLAATISLDNFSAGMATTAFVAYLSSLTNLQFSASQYAMLSSFMMLLPRVIGGYSGMMVESVGYQNFFLITALLGLPTVLLIAWQWRYSSLLEPHKPSDQ